MKMRVADYIAKFAYDAGVKDVFMLTGGGIMHLTDGVACNKDLNVICLHHEQAVSMAIEAYARYTGNFAVGYFTTGPGATNALTGLAGAWLDSTPCLFISGQAKRSEAVYKKGIPGLRQVGVQEINIIPVVESLTKYTAFVDEPEDIRYHLEKAYYLAKEGRPGPVWLDIPSDVQGAIIEVEGLRGFEPQKEMRKLDGSQVEAVAEMVKASKRPVILVGQGVRISGAIESLHRLSEKHRIPVITTYLGIDVMESDHPRYVGRIGIKGDRAGNLAMQNSDLLIIVGTSLPVAEIGYDHASFAMHAKKVVVDVDTSSHKTGMIKIDRMVEADAGEFLEAMMKALKGNKLPTDPTWLPRCIGWRERYPVCLPEYAELRGRINIYRFVDRLCRALGKGDIVVTDAGSAFFAGSQAVKIKRGMRYITSGGFATMGYSLPASIGISVAAGGKRVMCITGDGSFQQNIQELQSVVHYRLPIKIFILNNGGYLSIRTTQEKFCQGRLIGEGPKSGVSFPDAGRIAKAYGIKFVRVKDNKGLDKAISEVLRQKGPVICEVMTPPNQEIIPTVSSVKLDDGRMVSKPLEDMYPFLDRDELSAQMYIKPSNRS